MDYGRFVGDALSGSAVGWVAGFLAQIVIACGLALHDEWGKETNKSRLYAICFRLKLWGIGLFLGVMWSQWPDGGGFDDDTGASEEDPRLTARLDVFREVFRGELDGSGGDREGSQERWRRMEDEARDRLRQLEYKWRQSGKTFECFSMGTFLTMLMRAFVVVRDLPDKTKGAGANRFADNAKPP